MQKHTKIHGFAKFKLIVILALMSSIAPLSTDMYLPALSHVEQSFQTNSFLTQLSIASFFIAFALGQLIYGPLSDIFGRKIPALVGIFFFIVSSLFCVIIDDIYAFIALRFFEALGGCAGVVIARAIVNDLFEIKEAAGIFALMMVFSSLAPMLSPTFGGILLEYFSWHSIFATLFALGILLFLMIMFISTVILLANAFFHPNFLLFGANALGFVICANINARLVLKYESEKILAKALMIMFISTVILLANAFFHPNFLLFELSIFTSIAMLGFIAPNTTTLAMARFKEHSGTASAVLGTVQFGFAGLISFVVGAINANTPIILAFVMCACVLVANMIYFLIKIKEKK
ncbi:MFS transporter [Campylobacter jejuni]|uniref:MFS transporter n=1 Tax=Campylobacter jejuni TaxID=197 RepID=UPI000A100AFA|nr:MFS transporter [Campylobacter jejuni]